MIRVEYGDNYYDILNEISYTKASNEVEFDDLVIDFTGHSIEELPKKYQEVRLVDIEEIEYSEYSDNYFTYPSNEYYLDDEEYPLFPEQNKQKYRISRVIYKGFVDNYKINSRKTEDEDVELSITLLTPMKMATVRYISLYGSYRLDVLIENVLEPLVRDGFNISELDVPENIYKVKWTLKSVENAMNILCNIYNLWWYIDENKNIYIKSIDDLLNSDPKQIIRTGYEIKGLYSIEPELDIETYANQLSIKNARVVRRAEGCGVGDNAYPRIFFDRLNKVYQDEDYEFDNPLVFYKPEQYSENQVVFRIFLNKYAIYVTGMLSDGTIKGYYYVNPVYSQSSDGEISITSYTKRVENKGMAVQADGTGYEDEDDYIILFKRDSFFSNLITGFKYKGTTTTVRYPKQSPYSDTALVYEIYTIKDKAEIMNKKGVISDSGVVENIVDANGKWFTENQLHTYAINKLDEQKGSGAKVTLKTDEEPNINVGDLIEIRLPSFYVDDKYICTKITREITKDEYIKEDSWNMEFINAEINSTFIDLFRTNDTEEDEDETVYHVTGIYDSERVHEKVNILPDKEV